MSVETGIKAAFVAIGADVKSVFSQLAGLTVSASQIVSGTVSISRLPEATAAQFRNKTANRLLSSDQVWNAAAEVTLSNSSTIPVNMANFINAKVTITANRTLGNPSNEKVGQCGHIRVIGNYSLSFQSQYVFADGEAPSFEGNENVLFYKVLASNRIFISHAKNVN